jgi:hypothetical protein
MADYRDLAAALGGGYGQDTGGITPDTLATLRNGKKASAADLLGMLKDFGSGSLSNLESLVRGGVAQIPGTAGDLEGLARMGINKAFGAGGVNVNPTPVLPTTTDILGMMPRITAKRPETTGMEELGGYMAPAFGKVAKPTVMATGRLAGQEINAAMTGQPTRSLLGTITPKPLQLDVYHGTPHTLPPTERNPLGEFDASKIGTGEGAQAYGYGIYTAEAPAVAKEYQKQLGTQMKYKGEQFYNPIVGRKIGTTGNTEIDDYLLSYLGDTGVIRKELLNAAKEMRESNNPQALKQYQTLMSEFRKIRPDVTAANTGNLYKVDLPDEKIATMLDWDKPVSQQKNVMNALRNEAEQRVKNNLLVNIENDIRSKLPVQEVGDDYLSMFSGQNVALNQDIRQQALDKLNQLDLKPLVEKELNTFKPLDMNWDMTGKDFYEILSTRSGSAQQASNILQQQGVAGIKYLDELSRRPGVASMTQSQIDARISSLKKDIGSGLGNQERMKQQLASLEQERASHRNLTRNFVVFPGEEKNMTILERNAEKSAK